MTESSLPLFLGITKVLPIFQLYRLSKGHLLFQKARFYSDADPKTTAWQLLDLERCKNKSLIGICFYSVLDPKLTALLINSLLDLDRCKHKCLVEICVYSDLDPKLVLDQERLTFFQRSIFQTFWWAHSCTDSLFL